MDLQPLTIERDEPKRPATPRRYRWIGPMLVMAALVGIVVFFRAPLEGLVDRMRLPEVRTMRVAKSNPAAAASVSGTSANGYIVAKTRAALSADTPGRIVELHVEEGSVVKKGDIVARLYSDEYAALLRHAEADLALAETGIERARAEKTVADHDLARLKSLQGSAEADIVEREADRALAEIEHQRAVRLLEDGIDTIERRDQAKTRLDSATAQVTAAKSRLEAAAKSIAWAESNVAVAAVMEKEALARVDVAAAARDQAKATLDKMDVRAPFDGIVVLKDAEVGEVVSPNVQGGSNARGSVVTMVDFESLEVQAEVPETTLAAVVIGRPATIYLDAFPEKAYSGRVDRIWPTANRTKATVEVRVAFLERDDKLRPEMGVRVVFQAEGAPPPSDGGGAVKAALLVPSEATIKDGGRIGVFVLERDRARFREIVLGAERAGKVVVESGLSEGDTIILAPPPSLADGDRVRVKSGS